MDQRLLAPSSGMDRTRLALLALLLPTPLLLLPALPGCSGGNPASPSMSNEGGSTAQGGSSGSSSGASEAGGGGDEGGMPESSDPGDAGGGGTPVPVTFSYTPQWTGVTKVEVVGGFGLASDWSKTDSLLSLSQSGATWSGTTNLAPGTYLYVFRVTGDDQAMPKALVRYAVDPLETAFAPCPALSPTYSKIDVNPCSQIAVTAAGGAAPAAAVHVKGAVTVSAAPAKDWLVILERNEPKSHHFFANRVTVGADGSFDLVGSAGNYRLQIWYPTLESQTDLERDPNALNALRRAISATLPLGASDVTVTAPDLAFTAYAQFAPVGDGGALPTQFTFENGAAAHLDVYGAGGDAGVTNIGDPWFSSAAATDGGAVFAGSFNTAQALEDAATPGLRYMWGTEETTGADAGVTWTKQTMVFPIVWQ